MNRAGLLGLVGVVVVGAGAWWWFGHHETRQSTQAQSTHPSPSRSVSPSTSSGTPTPSSSPSTGTSTAATTGLGSLQWATQWRAVLAHQWGSTPPPLWIVPALTVPHAWLALEPLAHGGYLWWGWATPKHPLPTFQRVATNLTLTNAQIAALPPVMQGALNQAYDLNRSRPWPLKVQTPPLAANGAMSVAQAEANGIVGNPIGWQIYYSPHVRGGQGIPGMPAQLQLTVVQPWATQGAHEWVGESMGVQASGKLTSGAEVTVLMNGQTLTPLPTTDFKALEPTSVKAGLETAAN